MSLPDITTEIVFQTTRSGGKGGQNVNKVETAVIGSFAIDSSMILNEEQKQLIKEKLSNRINKEGVFMVKSQVHRSQLGNKVEVIRRMLGLVEHALEKKKPRIASKASKASKERRLESKKEKRKSKCLAAGLDPDSVVGNFEPRRHRGTKNHKGY